MYQIWPRSFNDSDGDGIGDLGGILERLDYLNDGRGGGLGVDAVWISPFYPSPLADFGYDVADYTAIDPLYGTIEQFERLLEQAHRRSMKILLDLVPNHTSDQHSWFVQARSSREDPYRDWYVWRDPGPDGGPPNNWLSAFPAAGSAWTLDEPSGQYYLHTYGVNQPDLNWENPEVRAAIADVMRFWFDRGVDGFRIDVVHRLAKDPCFGDNPSNQLEPEPTGPGRRDADWGSMEDRLSELRAVADEYADILLVGEVYILDQSRLVDYLGRGKLHLAHNFVFLSQDWSSAGFADVVEEFERLVPADAQGAWCLNNHDHSRVVTRFGSDGEAKARAAAMILLGLRGTAFLYQGEELGLPDTHLDEDTAVDIDGRDSCRTPMPWSSPALHGAGAGFSNGTPWLPVGGAASRLNSERQSGDKSSMLNHYRRLIALRKATRSLRYGTFRSVYVDSSVWAFVRELDGERVVVVTNFDGEPKGLPKSIGWREDDLIIASSVADPEPDRLESYESRWVVQKSPQKSS